VLGAAGFHQSKGRYLTILIPSPTGENNLGSPIIDVSLKRCDCIDAKSTISRKQPATESQWQQSQSAADMTV
jgi:hypothetical protein